MKKKLLLAALCASTNIFSQLPGNGMTDFDGNIYNSVILDTQEWVKENLNVAHYNDGTVIPQVTDPAEWANLTTGAWCYFDNNAANGAIYGKLYNWYAVAGIHDTISSTPNKVLAPTGFHVPTHDEWITLTTFLGGLEVAGGEMKEVGTAHWETPNTGATNNSNFTGLGDGFRMDFGFFTGMGLYANWWSSTETLQVTANQFYPWIRHLDHDNIAITQSQSTKTTGFSVRLISDTLFSDTPSNMGTIKGETIRIYPNPAANNVVIDLNSLTISSNWIYAISNTLSQEISRGKIISQQTIINLNDALSKGLYFVKVYDALGNVLTTEKLLVE
jgi:uncharacterized protein (TIGR02145 family)